MMLAVGLSYVVFILLRYVPSRPTFFFCHLKKIIYFWLHWVFVAMHALSSCAEQGLLFVALHRLLISVASLVAEHGL